MTATIHRRVEALEAVGAAGVDFIMIVRMTVRPGEPATEAAFAEMLGQRFARLPTETEANFIARLRLYADEHRQPGQRAVSVFCDAIDFDL